jgi:hypothetical protein
MFFHTKVPWAAYNKDYSVYVTDLNGKFEKNLLPQKLFKPTSGKFISISSMNEGFYFMLDTLSLWDTDLDTIYRILSNKEIIPRYSLYAGKRHLTWSKRFKTDDPDRSLRNSSIYFDDMVESNDHIFLRARNKGQSSYFIFDKESKETQQIIPGKGYGGIPYSRGLINDIDGGIPFWPSGSFSSEELFQIIEPNHLRSHFSAYEKIPAVHPFNKVLNENLKELLQETELDSNQWLIIAKLK